MISKSFTHNLAFGLQPVKVSALAPRSERKESIEVNYIKLLILIIFLKESNPQDNILQEKLAEAELLHIEERKLVSLLSQQLISAHQPLSTPDLTQVIG
jgi:hypothetical protein